MQICHPAASSFGGNDLPPDEPAVCLLGHGPFHISPVDPAVTPPNELTVGGTAGRGTAIAVLYSCTGPSNLSPIELAIGLPFESILFLCFLDLLFFFFLV